MIWIIIIGMALVTVIPRILPVFIVESVTFPKWMEKMLEAIPYAALGALIFPGIMGVIPNNAFAGIAGGVVAILLSYFRMHIILVVCGAIATVFLISSL
ncbi:AzlD domain-containing protein [Saliterribacillus persicus]|uniref:Branched-subunit amino acid transport protein n=1 Tax=Saliterribacillus persicus TaxID=930114 RepID=A0A368XNS6_9BACI|nr:AzlD domain-containing protein [Saliterribacillus persicus]RCW69640.1 branched-subunit amino acid transport protein [Saliterribacillus persicus]